LFVTVVAVVVIAMILLWRWAVLTPEIALPFLLLAGAVLFIGALALLAGMFRRLKLSEAGQPLALPEGSVRALLALILVFLFFVAALFLFGAINSQGPDRHLRASGSRYEQIPTDQIVNVTPIPTTSPTEYDVTVKSRPNEASSDIAKQLITVLGTLVTAIAAFYFGANTTLAAARPRSGATPGPTGPVGPAGPPGPVGPPGTPVRTGDTTDVESTAVLPTLPTQAPPTQTPPEPPPGAG
jgi:hypothetical protein